uniref:Ceramide synthase 1 n=2 Tax=Schistocephalus solidus TaxID=70667 RepID=A0A0V0JAP9_SCHSO
MVACRRRAGIAYTLGPYLVRTEATIRRPSRLKLVWIITHPDSGFKMACALFSSVLTTGISSALAMPGMQATLSDAGEDCDYHRQAALPTVTNFLRQTYIAVQELAFNWEKYPYDHEFTVRMFTDGLPGLYEVGLILALTFSFIIFRIIVDPILRAFLRRVKFRECDVQKFPECFFRSIYYICITAYGVKTIYLSGKYVFFQEPCTGFDLNPDLDQYFSHPMPTDLLILYWVQFSYYFSNVYMVQFLDTVKKDTGMMMIHHIVTLLLIGFSYLARYVKVGCVVYLLHDVSDAILESGKLLIYYNGRENKRHPWGELISTSLFVAFTCSWFYLRIYLFPLHLLHAANWCIYLKRDFMMLKFYLLFNFLLVALFTMHLVWGWFILRMAFRLVIGQSNRLEDIREEEESNGHILKEKKA